MHRLESISLWALTRGHRARYGAAGLAISLGNLLLFAGPLVARYAVDVVVAGDLTRAPPWLVAPASFLGFAIDHSFARYLAFSAVAIVLVTTLPGSCQYLRGRLAAHASESIARRLRDELYRRLHHLRASFFDTADTGDLVPRCSSDV